jgi:hypothetical protein
MQAIFVCTFVIKCYCNSSNDVICLCWIVTMMTWARCHLHLLTKGPNLLGLNVKCSAHIHTRQCRGQLVTTCFNGHSMRPIVSKTAYCYSDAIRPIVTQMLLGKNTCHMALSAQIGVVSTNWRCQHKAYCYSDAIRQEYVPHGVVSTNFQEQLVRNQYLWLCRRRVLPMLISMLKDPQLAGVLLPNPFFDLHPAHR